MSTAQLLSKSEHRNRGLDAGMMRPTRDYSALDKTVPSSLSIYSSRPEFFLTFLSAWWHIQEKSCANFVRKPETIFFSLWLNKIGICYWSHPNQCKSGAITSKSMVIISRKQESGPTILKMAANLTLHDDGIMQFASNEMVWSFYVIEKQHCSWTVK